MNTVAPFTAEEREQIQHTGHFLMEKVIGDAVDLVAIGGAVSGKRLRRFARRSDLDAFCKTEDIAYRTREGT